MSDSAASRFMIPVATMAVDSLLAVDALPKTFGGISNDYYR
jgi:hypothetical protein